MKHPSHKIEKAVSALELPYGILGGAHIELCSNREVNIDGCGGILEYDEGLVRVNASGQDICIYGRGLHISCLCTDQCTVKGYITRLAFA